MFLGYFAESAGSSEIDSKSGEKNQNGCDAGLNVNGVEKEAVEGFIDDVERRENEECGFHERRKVFEFTVTVKMAIVRGLIGDSDREESNDGGHEIETGMQRFRENAEATGAPDKEGFQAKKQGGRANAEKSGALFFLDRFLKATPKGHGIRVSEL
jgi:hypothetical protein